MVALLRELDNSAISIIQADTRWKSLRWTRLRLWREFPFRQESLRLVQGGEFIATHSTRSHGSRQTGHDSTLWLSIASGNTMRSLRIAHLPAQASPILCSRMACSIPTSRTDSR